MLLLEPLWDGPFDRGATHCPAPCRRQEISRDIVKVAWRLGQIEPGTIRCLSLQNNICIVLGVNVTTQIICSPWPREMVYLRSVCIGRQGTVRYCHHNVVEWRKVAILSRWLCELQLDDVKTLPRVVIDECEEHSHGPKHHSPSSLLLFPGGIKPTVELRGDERNGLTMFIQSSGHLLLPSPEELGQENVITPKLMHKLLRSLRQDSAEWIVPELPLGRLIEMNCFDPNLCRCLHYAGIEQLPQKW